MITLRVRATGPLFNVPGLAVRFDREVAAEVANLGALGQRLVVQGTPAGISSGGGGLRGSITLAFRGQPAQRQAIVASTLFYAPIRELGRAPEKMPPPAALRLWVQRKLGVPSGSVARVAFLVARKIGRSGYQGAFMFSNAMRRLEPIAATRWQALGTRLAAIANGR